LEETEVIICFATLEDKKEATEGGLMRYDDNVKKGRKDTMGIDSKWSHILGAMGELVVARTIGIPWSPKMGSFKKELDVGPYEVRTRSIPDGTLMVRKNDAPDRTYVLVVPTKRIEGKEFEGQVLPDVWRIVGMMTGAAAQQEQYWNTNYKAYCVPQRDLESFPDPVYGALRW
jgi:hypothetical protein